MPAPGTPDTDAVLDWLKNGVAAADDQALRSLEHSLRQRAVRDWSAWRGDEDMADVVTLTEQVNAWRLSLQRSRPLGLWLSGLQELLQATGQWAALQADRLSAPTCWPRCTCTVARNCWAISRPRNFCGRHDA
ncbi:MAG: hypothetical protein IPO19_13335 [Rhodoferax sp.]|nr:hypothetical protein [Rhodoferax sp.]